MSIAKQFEAGVDSAFDAAGDLVRVGTFTSTTVNGYDWTTRSVTGAGTPPYDAELLPYVVRRPDAVVEQRAIVKSADLESSLYSEVTFNGETYNIVDIVDHRFIKELVLKRKEVVPV